MSKRYGHIMDALRTANSIGPMASTRLDELAIMLVNSLDELDLQQKRDEPAYADSPYVPPSERDRTLSSPGFGRLEDSTDAMRWAEAFCTTYRERLVGITHQDEGCAATNLIEPGWLVTWFANAMSAQEQSDSKRVADVCRALRHTVEYVGAATLPARNGWSHHEALMKYDPSYPGEVAQGIWGDGNIGEFSDPDDDLEVDEGKYRDDRASTFQGDSDDKPVDIPSLNPETFKRLWAIDQATERCRNVRVTTLGSNDRPPRMREVMDMAEWILKGEGEES